MIDRVRPFATAMLVAYDGSRGWAWDPGIKAVLGETLGRIMRDPAISIEAASRTDAGVHARGQAVCAFSTHEPLGGDMRLLRYRVNQLLPEDLVVREAAAAPPDFDVRDNAGKIYRYRLNTAVVADPLSRRTEWHLPSRHNSAPFCTARASEAAAQALGRHSFAQLANAQAGEDERDPICELRRFDVVQGENGRVHFEVEGDRFLYRMVRNLAGLIARCGSGELEPHIVARILADGAWPKGVAKLTAPAHGLELCEVLLRAERNPFGATPR